MSGKLNVLILCEESGVMRQAFRELGHDAWSCDIEPARDASKYHFQDDCLDVLSKRYHEDKALQWDLIIFHPPCEKMCVSGNRWYGKGMAMHGDRLRSISWTTCVWDHICAATEHAAMENPVSVLWKYQNCPVDYVQPFEYGHQETKKTGLALHNLPPLKPTNVLVIPPSGSDERKSWEKVWRMAPGPNRKRDRSETYSGIAAAAAAQWSAHILQSQRNAVATFLEQQQ